MKRPCQGRPPKYSHDSHHTTSMMSIMRKAAGTRAESKRESLDKILDAAARRIREKGLDGAGLPATVGRALGTLFSADLQSTS